MTCRPERRTLGPRALLLPLLLAACGGEGKGLIAPELCERLDIVDETGAPVLGIEDIAVDHEMGRLYLSAHDRRAVAAELDSESGPVTTGGLYRLDMDGDPRGVVTARALVASEGERLPLRPHGMGLYISESGTRHVFAIERAFARDGEGWRAVPEIAVLVLGADGLTVKESARLRLPPELCSPNDLFPTLAGIYVSNDRGACDGRDRLIEDALGLGNSFVARLTPAGMETVANRLRFANGVAMIELPDGRRELAVAATRADAIFFFPPDARGLSRRQALSVERIGAGPDNLTVAPDGALIAAAHPGIYRYALFRFGSFGVERAPSRVFRIATAADGERRTERLFDDREGRAISGATAAAVHDGRLWLAAAFDDHMAVCPLPDGTGS